MEMDEKQEGDSRGTVAETKKQIKERNKDSEAINSHAKLIEGGNGNMLGLIIVYKDGTYDKHIVNFNRQAYMTMVNEKEKIVKYKGELFKLTQEGAKDGN